MQFFKQLLFRGFVTATLLSSATYLQAQDKQITTVEYINMYKGIAIREMKLTGIPASITIAQGILESNKGNSALTKNAKNHFGIKCKNNWTGKTYYMSDDEDNECFRSYTTDEESYLDHSYFLVVNARYDTLFNMPPTDFANWAKGLKYCGYATNPRYADLLIEVINKYELYKFDDGNQQLAKADRLNNVKSASNQLAIANVKPGSVDNSYKGKKEKDKEAERIVENNINKENTDRIFFDYNGIKALVSKSGDTWESIARENNMMYFEVKLYNDLNKYDEIEAGTVLYLRAKHNKGQKETHTVVAGESMYYISQLEGIKLKKLYKYNHLKPGQEPQVNEVIKLRSKTQVSPKYVDAPVLNKGLRYAKVTGKKSELAPVKANQIVAKPTLTESETAVDTSTEWHIVKPGENTWSIVSRYGISISNLQDWNNLTSIDGIKTGQQLRIKNTKGLTKEKKTISPRVIQSPVAEKPMETEKIVEKQAMPRVELNAIIEPLAANQYEVGTGEGLWSISKKTGVSVLDLKDYNQLKSDVLLPGQRLWLVDARSLNIDMVQATAMPEFHIVSPGEGLYAIARKYNTTTANLRELNQLTQDNLQPNQKLKLK